MHPHALLALGLALVGLAQLMWASLALPGAVAIGGPLAAEGVAFAIASGAVALRRYRPAAVALALAAVAELAFLALFPGGFDAASLALGSLGIAGAALLAWRLRAGALDGLAAGAILGALGTYGYALKDLLAQDAFLLAGYFAALPGWALVVYGASRAPADRALAPTGAHAGARP